MEQFYAGGEAGPKRQGAETGAKLSNRETWEHCWSFARFCLRLSNEEFYDLTPRQFQMLADRYREQQTSEQYHTGLLASMIGNFSIGAPKESLRPEDFFPALRSEEKAKEPSGKSFASGLMATLMALYEAQHNKQ